MEATRRGFLSFLGGLFGVAAVGVPEVEATAPAPEPEPESSPVEPPLTPEEAYANVLRSGMIEPALHTADLICPPGGSVTWCVSVQHAMWLRSIELPADMEVEQVTIAGIPGTVVPLAAECGTCLVDDGPPERISSAPWHHIVGRSSHARAYRVAPLPGSVSLFVDLRGFVDQQGMRVASPGQPIAMTFRQRAGTPHGLREFQARLRGDQVDPVVQAAVRREQQST